MSEASAFPDFIRRIRAGDDRAARELVERYRLSARRDGTDRPGVLRIGPRPPDRPPRHR